jgi:hypothetical protein
LAVTNNVAALSDWVAGNGVLSYHDRYVSGGSFNMADVLPGAAGATFVRDFSNGADIDILNGTTIVTTSLNNTSLDGGFFSSHGYVDGTTLPFGAVGILNRGGATNEIVDFYYPYGAGSVYYSTIPLDFYIAGFGSNPPQGNFANVYAVNEAKFQAGLQSNAVPEPGTMGLFGLAAIRRKNRAREWGLA